MNTTTAPSIKIREHAGYTYVVTSDGVFGKGCRRCGGTGHYSFDGFDSLCYNCRNIFELRLGDVFDTEEQAQKWCEDKKKAQEKRDAKREQMRLAKIAKRDAAWQALKDQAPAVWDLLSSVVGVTIPFDESKVEYSSERDPFVLSLADRLWKLDERPLTERQVAAAQRVAEKRAERAATASENPAPLGRQEVTGVIVSAKVRESDFGTQYKITVQDDRGFRVYVSLPKAQAEEAMADFERIPGWDPYTFGSACWFLGVETSSTSYPGVKGRRITFTATLEQSKDDASFAFGNRPTKGAWL